MTWEKNAPIVSNDAIVLISKSAFPTISITSRFVTESRLL